METRKLFLACSAFIGVSLLAGQTATSAPNLRNFVLGNWQWQERQFYAFADDQTGILSQDGKIFVFRWSVTDEGISMTFLDSEGRELFTWNASADPDPLLLRIQTRPGRPAVQVKRVPKIPFRRGFAAGT